MIKRNLLIFILVVMTALGITIMVETYNKGNIMNLKDTYIVKAPNGDEILFDKETNLIVSENHTKETNALKEKSQMLLDSRKIIDSSPYANYNPLYYNPAPDAFGQTDYLKFKEWLDISYKQPPKGKIAPWTKKEKAYYQSLKTKRERYIYLIKRSGLKCTMIDLPDDAIGRVDEKGRLTKPEYADLYNEVERHRRTLKSELFEGEWNLCAGILGDTDGFFSGSSAGFNARGYQSIFLAAQLGAPEALDVLSRFSRNGWLGVAKNKARALEYKLLFNGWEDKFPFLSKYPDSIFDPFRSLLQQDINLIHTHPIYDEFGMIPYLDEIIGVDWVLDFNQGGLIKDAQGAAHMILQKMINDGEILDPRDLSADEKSREEFMNEVKSTLHLIREVVSGGFPNNWDDRQINLYIDSTILESKIISLTPPQGYPNAPYYHTPEELKELYEAGKLDKRLNPLIPAMYREHFPKELREKIEQYAKEHNIKD